MTRTSSEIHCSMTTMLRKLSSIFTRTSNSSRPLSTELAGRLKGFDAPTVWSEFTPLSQQHKSVNLGQGFPDWESPPFVKEAMVAAIHENHNQYCRSGGELSLVNELSAHYSKLIGRTINPLTEVTVSVGATEGIFALMQALVNEGDEVIVIEPNFDIYPAQVQMAGGVCKGIPLQYDKTSGQWRLDLAELEQLITPRTKILLLNTPHNPTGKVFSEAELLEIATLLGRHPQVTVVMDEVYEKLVYDGRTHVRMASLPGMWDRTLTVSSCGKTFSCTGWKVGWVYGPERLIKPIMLANQWVQYSVSTPTQSAMAKVLARSEQPYEGFSSYYAYICNVYEKKRDYLVESLRAAKLQPIVPEGGFFIMADTSSHTDKVADKYRNEPGPRGEVPVTKDWAFARWLTAEIGVTPIPPSAFYTDETKHLAADFARFAFCKTDPLLVEGRKRLAKLA